MELRSAKAVGHMHYLELAAIVLAVNLLPAFGPPTWAVLVLLKLDWHLSAAPTILIGAAAAAVGRYVLARTTRALRTRLSERRLESLRAAQELLMQRRVGALVGLALFALSPLPSAQLFEAAGILAVPLVPLTLAFFAGRLVTYTVYVTAATLAQESMGSLLISGMKSPLGITLQVLMLGLVVALTMIDPARLRRLQVLLRRKRPARRR